jgi:hypothetical protein
VLKLSVAQMQHAVAIACGLQAFARSVNVSCSCLLHGFGVNQAYRVDGVPPEAPALTGKAPPQLMCETTLDRDLPCRSSLVRFLQDVLECH